GNVSAARGAARPLHVQHHRRLPEPGRGIGHHEADHRCRAARAAAPAQRRADPAAAGGGAAGGRRRPRLRVRRPPGAGDPAAPAARRGGAARPREPGVPKFIPELTPWGAGPGASQSLILGGKARAILHGRLHVTTDDIKAVAYPVLRHRLVTTFNADAEGVTTDVIVKRLIEAIPLPQEASARAVRA